MLNHCKTKSYIIVILTPFDFK